MTCAEFFLGFISASGTVGAFWVSYRLFKLQQAIERAKIPTVKIWFRHGTTEEGNVAILTMVNFGENPLPIKRMDVDHEAGTTLRYNLLKDGEQIIDWLVQPNQVHTIAVLPTGGTVGNFKLRVQYFDASFVFLNIDTSWLGPYWLDQTSAGKQTTKILPFDERR